MVSHPNATYAPRLGANSETEISSLVSVYRFVLDCHKQKKGSRPEPNLLPEARDLFHGYREVDM